MTEDSCSKASEESMANGTQLARQRKKRKWDQPAESFLSAGLAVPGISFGALGNLSGITLPGVCPISGAVLANGLPGTGATIPQTIQGSSIQQSADAIVQKLNQPKIQDELIAREIVINDAEPTVRYKLTKRQTQEEIQKSTGAVVITRGKYRPPNGLPDNEKPLYLHISAGAHLKDTVELIKAVDRAAAMVEEIMKQGQNSQSVSTSSHAVISTGLQVPKILSACVFLGFEPDSLLNIPARIRGPNDQYINHIMNETGAVVVLRGCGSGNVESSHGVDDNQQPLHLYLSSNNIRSLEAAKLLAENLLDTISAECGASRVSSSRVYSAVPPPQQLLTTFPSCTVEQKTETSASATLACSPVWLPPVPPNFPAISSVPSVVTPSVVSTTCQQVTPVPPGGTAGYVQPHTNANGYPQLSVHRGTSYSGYGGIYPQATPLQQVALALKQAPPSAASTVSSTTPVANTKPNPASSVAASATEVDKRKRKFQELPVLPRGPTDMHQNSCPGSEFLKPGVTLEDRTMRNISNMPPPKKLIQTDYNGIMPPLPRSMPPPPPKFSSPAPPPPSKFIPPPPPVPKFTTESHEKPLKALEETSMGTKPTANVVSDTLIKLAEYGDEDDEDEENEEDVSRSSLRRTAASKPFWAV
ncbi:hypothetical protein H6P81_019256 [Aristolochia fimbriata]|uniref:Protein RIK n=1 Tax=Aristolochia fimbriata TaxID=158543 RepID=A0AAV7DU84_ARIFI|nr:hypothetical protein H6P81_019256 [Aristolochia fimbriata]